MSRSPGVALRVAAIVLCGVGASLIGDAAVTYARGWYRADVARQQWEALRASAAVAQARSRASSGISAAIDNVAIGAPVARLTIPRIHLDEIVLEGVGDDELNAAPGHLPGSALPGALGNAVISAHRDRHFSRLDELQLGDTITTETARGRGSWVIVGRRVVGRDAPALFQSSEPRLTLTTCWPVRYFGSAPDRLILSAKLIAGSLARGVTAPSGDT